jgi:hypothetical protein
MSSTKGIEQNDRLFTSFSLFSLKYNVLMEFNVNLGNRTNTQFYI